MMNFQAIGLTILAFLIGSSIQTNDLKCNSEKSVLCELKNGTHGCCPVSEGTCCESGDFCCPRGYLNSTFN